MTNPLYSVERFPLFPSTALAFEAFDERYLMALTKPSQDYSWVGLGEQIPTDHAILRFPLATYFAEYMQTQGENRTNTPIGNKFFEVKSEEFDTGIEEYLYKLQKDPIAARRWALFAETLPGRQERFVSKQLALLLEAGKTTIGLDGVNFFSSAHPGDYVGGSGSSGTFSNYQSTAKSVLVLQNILDEAAAMASVLDSSGAPAGVEPDTIMVPLSKGISLSSLLAQQSVLRTDGTSFGVVPNPIAGHFKVVVNPSLTDPDDWFLLDSRAASRFGITPWIVMTENVSTDLGLRKFDENSDFFKNHSRIKISSHLWKGFTLAFPQTIRLVNGA
ncbi:MAG TPA: hypothetical protein VNJ04_05200 [Gemmatimonadaceae bacterium]|nr:hypothetical protein [Gemmatimonadaceae bacterium]